MNLGKINLITPPDSLFNANITYLLVKPSTKLKVQFQTLLSVIDEEINVYIYDTEEVDIAWMLNAANNSDIIIIDIDNCDSITKNFISVLLANTNAFYMTADDITPWGLLSKNRIYNLDWLVEQINQAKKDLEDDENNEEDNDERE
jgi:hypothetical protein